MNKETIFRKLYRNEQRSIASWKNRDVPDFMRGE